MQEDEELLARAKTLAGGLRTIPIAQEQSALALWEPVCLKGDATSEEVLLLLPEEYELLEPRVSASKIAEVSEMLVLGDVYMYV